MNARHGSAQRLDRARKGSREERPKKLRSPSFLASSRSQSSLVGDEDQPGRFFPTLTRILESATSDHAAARRAVSPSPSQSSGSRRSSTRKASAPRKRSNPQDELQDRVRALVSPSMQSVVTTKTANTSSSSGSNSTVTQGSFSRKRDDRGHATSKASHRSRRKHRLPAKSSPEQINVFKFLQADSPPMRHEEVWQTSHSSDEEEQLHLPEAPEPPRGPSSRSSSASPILNRRPVRPVSWPAQDQLHSDSGISVRSSSTDSRVSKKGPAPAVEDVPDEALEVRADSGDAPEVSESHIERQDLRAHREGSGDGSLGQIIPQPFDPALAKPGCTNCPPYPPSYLGRPGESCESALTCAEHSSLAKKLSARDAEGGEPPPALYRRFDELNHRILLHLQEEICDLEDQIKRMDQCIDADPHNSGYLRFRRTDLLGRTFAKMNQYSKWNRLFQEPCKRLTAAKRSSNELLQRHAAPFALATRA